MAMGYKQLLKKIREDGKIEIPRDVSATTLARACYMQSCMNNGTDLWWESGYRLYDAIGDMLTFIRSHFFHGEKWANDNTLAYNLESAAYPLYEVLDKKGKFGLASRTLMDYVVRGAMVSGRRKARDLSKFNQEVML